MSDDSTKTRHHFSGGSTAATHPAVPALEVLASPATASEFNTIRSAIIPIACWRIEDILFAFDSSFVLPEVRDEMPALAKLIDDHTEKRAVKRPPPLSIFGHADPVGTDEYNKFLSGRRAAAIYGMLTRRDEIWEDIYSNTGIFVEPAPGDKWGLPALQTMASTVDPESAELESDPGRAKRKQIFLAYMDEVCVDAAGAPFQVDKTTGFLARNADQHGKGDFQGCGEFNPILRFSAEEQEALDADEDKTQRNIENAPNRRVMALLFRPGSKVDPPKWPCPLAKEGTAGCIKRFWSDAKVRRANQETRREFKDTHDTFACRFYQRLTSNSPCEHGPVRDGWIIRIEKAQGLAPGDKCTLESAKAGYHAVLSTRDAVDDGGDFLDFIFPEGPESDYDVSLTISGARYRTWLHLHLPGPGQGIQPSTTQYDSDQEEPDLYAGGGALPGRQAISEDIT